MSSKPHPRAAQELAGRGRRRSQRLVGIGRVALLSSAVFALLRQKTTDVLPTSRERHAGQPYQVPCNLLSTLL